MKRLMLVFLFLGITASKSANADRVGVIPFDTSSGVDGQTLTFESGVSYNGSRAEDLYYFSITHRKAKDFIRLPLYVRVEMGAFFGQGCKKKACNSSRKSNEPLELVDLNTPIVGVAGEITLFDHRYFDVHFSLGGHLKKSSSRVGSVFTFGERLAVNMKSKNHNFSLFVRHFSNASITPDNGGYNFVGLSFASRF